jgi:hypothetical protein
MKFYGFAKIYMDNLTSVLITAIIAFQHRLDFETISKTINEMKL